MEDAARNLLRQLLTRYGNSVIEDPPRFASLLNDARKGEHKREANLIIAALREGVPQHLLSASQGELGSMVVGRLASRLVEESGLAEDAARWAVESWALALGMEVDAPEPVAERMSVAPPASEKPSPQLPLQASGDWPTVEVSASTPVPTVAEPPATPVTRLPPSGTVLVSPARSSVSRPEASGCGKSCSNGCWTYLMITIAFGLIRLLIKFLAQQ